MIEKRPYQTRIVDKAVQAFERGLTSVMIESPCGSGKTVMGLSVAKKWEQQGYRVGWVAMRRNLLGQAARENEEKGFSVKNIDWISMFQNDLPACDCLILDETHHQAAPTCVTLLNRIKPKKYLGLTATPIRTDKVHLAFQKVISDAGIHVLIQQGFLSPYQHWTLPAYNPEAVAGAYAAERDKWGKALIFFLTAEECYRCQQLLAERGVPSEVVTAETDRDAQLTRFEAGEVQVLINVFILTEGFDAPDLRTVFVRPSGRSPSLQMGGRVFRRHPDKPFANVVQCKETRFAFPQRIKALAEWVQIDGVWYSVTGNANVPIVQAMSLRLIANASVHLPPICQRAAYALRHTRRRGQSTRVGLSTS
jgi:superfamily II DNA or RNA helicase